MSPNAYDDDDDDTDYTQTVASAPVVASGSSRLESTALGAVSESSVDDRCRSGTVDLIAADDGESSVDMHRESRAVACRLEPIVRVGQGGSDGTPTALETIRRMVKWMHGVRRDAHELINHHVLRVLEAGGTLPELHENAVVYRFLVAVTTMPGGSTTYAQLDAEIATTRSACMPALVRHEPLPGCVHVMELERVRYTAQLKTQVHRSFRKRVGRIVELRLRLDETAAAELSKEQRSRRKHATKIAMAAATKPRGSAGLVGEFATVVDNVIADFGIDRIDLSIDGKVKSMPYMLKAAPTRFLPALRRINLELEARGEARFCLVPMTTSNVPGFVSMDQRVLKATGLVGKAASAEINRRTKERRALVAPYTTRLRALRAEVSMREREWKEIDHQNKLSRYHAFGLRWIVDDLISQVEAEAEACGGTPPHPMGGRKRKRQSTSTDKKPRKRQAMPKTATPTDAQQREDEAETERRNAILQPFRDQIAAVESDPVYQRLVDDAAAERRDVFESVFDVSKAIRHPEQWTHSFSTDGYSARLMLNRPQRYLPVYNKSTDGPRKSTKSKLAAMPKRGIIPLEELKHLVAKGPPIIVPEEKKRMEKLPPFALNSELKRRLDMAHGIECPYLLMGLDPGKSELAVLTNPDVAVWDHEARLLCPLPSTERERKRRPETQAAIRYTSKERRFDTTPGWFVLNKAGRMDPKKVELASTAKTYRASIKPADPELLKTTIAGLSLYAKSAATGAGFKAFTDARRAAQPLLDATYGDDGLLHRKLRWKAFIDKQKSLQGFVDQLKAIERSTGKQIIIAYGAWGMHAGEAGSPVNKGSPPCLGVGLARHLARFFVVCWTPEHYTSKTCFHCGCHECCNHPKIAEQHRSKRDARALKRRDERLAHLEASGGTQAAKDKAELIYQKTISKVPELRSLRFCPNCTRCLNRDRNAANNIGLQFKRLVFGMGTIKAMSKTEREMNDADAEMEGGGE